MGWAKELKGGIPCGGGVLKFKYDEET